MLNIVKKDKSIKKAFDSYIKKENKHVKFDIEYQLFDYESKIIDFLKNSKLFNEIVTDKDRLNKIYISHYSCYHSPYEYHINIENSSFLTICILVIRAKDLLSGLNLEGSCLNLFWYNNRHFYKDKSKKKSTAYKLMLNVYEHKYKNKITKQIKEIAGFRIRFNDLFYYNPENSFILDFSPNPYSDISDLKKYPVEIESNSYQKMDYSSYREKIHFSYDNIRNLYLNQFNIENKNEFKDIFIHFRTIRKYFKALGIKSSLHLGSYDKFDIFIQLEINGIKDTFTIPYSHDLYEMLSNNISIMDSSQLEKINIPTEYNLKELLLNCNEILEMEKLKRY